MKRTTGMGTTDFTDGAALLWCGTFGAWLAAFAGLCGGCCIPGAGKLAVATTRKVARNHLPSAGGVVCGLEAAVCQLFTAIEHNKMTNKKGAARLLVVEAEPRPVRVRNMLIKLYHNRSIPATALFTTWHGTWQTQHVIKRVECHNQRGAKCNKKLALIGTHRYSPRALSIARCIVCGSRSVHFSAIAWSNSRASVPG